MIKRLLLSLLFVATLLNATPPTESTITRLYIATFDRAPDNAGLNYWLNDSGLDLEQIATSFFDQPETKEKYPTGFSNADFIQAIYKNLFKRDADSDSLTYTVESQPTHGTLGGTAPNVTYTPTADYFGNDSFTFKVNDGTVDSSSATVTITVTDVAEANNAPVATAQSVTVAEDSTANSITLAGTDADSDTLTFTVETQPTNGTLGGTAPNITYTPTADYFGSDSFTFKVNDGTVDSSSATVTITVTDVAEANNGLKKTGQTIEIFENDDGTHQKGVVHSYLRNNSLDIVLDSVTGLMWDDYNYANDNDANNILSWDQANSHCTTLDVNGNADWRLPTINELMYITDKGKHNLSKNDIFQNIEGESNSTQWYWSSTVSSTDSDKAWMCNYYLGHDMVHDKTFETNTMCVRGIGEESIASRFSRDNDNKIVTDSKTNLQWQDQEYTTEEQDSYTSQIAYEKVQTFSGAISYCNTLSLNGSGWRLPNFNELYYLTDRGSVDSELDSSFLNLISADYWSSTSLIRDAEMAWFVRFNDNQEGVTSKTYKFFIRCVRDVEEDI